MNPSRLTIPFVALFVSIAAGGCASTGARNEPVAQVARYAQQSNERLFEADMPAVWKAIEKAVSGYQVTDRDPKTVDVLEMRKLRSRTLATDWIYSQSRDKYDVAWANSEPRHIPLQSRISFKIIAETEMGGVRVRILTAEELEQLDRDGSSAGYHAVKPEQLDTSRAADILDRIRLALLSPDG